MRVVLLATAVAVLSVAATPAPKLALVKSFQRYSGEEGLAVGFGSVWTSSADSGDSVARTDIASGKSLSIHAPIDEDTALAAGPDAIWQTDFGHGFVRRIDPKTNRVTATATGLAGPAEIAFADGDVFVGLHHGQSVVELDGKSAKVVRRYPLPKASGGVTASGPAGIAILGNSIWVSVINLNAVLRVDRTTGKVLATVHAPDCGSLLATGSAIWAGCDGVVRIDPLTNRVVATVKVATTTDVVSLNGRVWTTSGASVVGIDPGRAKVVVTQRFKGAFFTDLAAYDGHLWPFDANAVRVDELAVG